MARLIRVHLVRIVSVAATLVSPALAVAADAPPFAGMVRTFDYVPARDGIGLLSGGPTQAGYAAARPRSPYAVWQPRYDRQGIDPRGGSDVYNGDYQWNADPAFPWPNHYSPFALVDGGLRIRAARVADLAFGPHDVPINPTTGKPYPYVSGLLSSQETFSQQLGYFEATMRIPTGRGVWPAFWLLPLGSHPPEIDVIEGVYDLDPPTVYRATAIAIDATTQTHVQTGVDLTAAPHRYGVLWTDTMLRFYFDRRPVATVDLRARPEFQQPFYLLLNQQIGSTLREWVPPPDATSPAVADLVVSEVAAWQAPGPLGVDLSATSYLDTLPAGGVVGQLSAPSFGDSGRFVFTKSSDPGKMFALAGDRLTLARQVPARTRASHPVGITVTDGAGRSRTRLFTIGVFAGAPPRQANYLPSRDFGAPFWAKAGVVAAAPGVLRETAAVGPHRVAGVAPMARAAGVRTMEFHLDMTPDSGRTEAELHVADAGWGSQAFAIFDLSGRGAVDYVTATGAWTGARAFVIPLGGASFRCGLRWTTDAATTGLRASVALATGIDGQSYPGDASRGMRVADPWLFDTAAPAGRY